MKSTSPSQKYLALLRGINVGGHHKVPMEDLKLQFREMGFSKVQTLLNSGNVIFEGPAGQGDDFEVYLSTRLAERFGFLIPVLISDMEMIKKVVKENPFKHIPIHKDLRFYVTFLKSSSGIEVPLVALDGCFQIPSTEGKMVFSVLDVSGSKTTDAMKLLEKTFGKELTTRNWNTVVKAAVL